MSERRDKVPFDPYLFQRLAERGETLSRAETFRRILRDNHWAGPESVSGTGAGRSQTRVLERQLPELFGRLGVEILLDVPCGDFGWMRRVAPSVPTYIGGDIVPALVEANRARYADARRRFEVLDLTTDPLPPADLMLCRDALVHLSFEDIGQALANVRGSDIGYLLTTTFPGCRENEDIVTGDWRVLNLQRPPFDFPEPEWLLEEGCTEGGGAFRDKSLGLWRVADLPGP